jgi:hypothetical protein
MGSDLPLLGRIATMSKQLMLFTWVLWPIVSVLGMIMSDYLYSREWAWVWLLWPITIPLIIAAQTHEEYKQNNAN